MSEATNLIQHTTEGVGAMKAGSTITIFSVLGTWLTDNGDLIGVICMLIGTTIGLVGFVRNDRARSRKEKREQELHEYKMGLRVKDGPEL